MPVAFLLAGLPAQILSCLRSDRDMRHPTPPGGHSPKGGRPPKHGGEFVLGDAATWGAEQAVTVTDTRLYGQGDGPGTGPAAPEADASGGLAGARRTPAHHRGHRIRLVVDKLPSGGVNKPVWL
ncbi:MULTISPECIES: hypothetical protein [unclassified Streptomyces]|uniref:hypothetical protein n=1 Tax=unclassified Streptomyces TaxID=2593676 RepID=UPI002034BB32|nr:MULTISPECIES: hypothetical protein [unclassified Streptomyces]